MITEKTNMRDAKSSIHEQGEDLLSNGNGLGSRFVDLFIFGCGVVGGALIEQLRIQQSVLETEGIRIRVLGIANRSKFYLSQNDRLTADWRENLQNSTIQYSMTQLQSFILDRKLVNPIIVDCTGSLDVATRYQQWLANGIHIVTANKIANTLSIDTYEEIRRLAKANNRQFRYETNIGAGLPFIEPLQKLLRAGDKVERFEGILSGSLSYIFGEIQSGMTLSEATRKAKELGFTEPDPREDLSGLDVARKVLIVARELGLRLELSDIQVDSVIPVEFNNLANVDVFFEQLKMLDVDFESRVKASEANNTALRYVARLDGSQCRVSIQAVALDNPLYGVVDGENVLALYSRYYSPKPMVIKGYGAGPSVTAAGVFSDILRIID